MGVATVVMTAAAAVVIAGVLMDSLLEIFVNGIDLIGLTLALKIHPIEGQVVFGANQNRDDRFPIVEVNGVFDHLAVLQGLKELINR